VQVTEAIMQNSRGSPRTDERQILHYVELYAPVAWIRPESVASSAVFPPNWAN